MVSETVAIFASTSSDGSVHIWEVTFPSTNGGQPRVLWNLLDLSRFHGYSEYNFKVHLFFLLAFSCCGPC